MSLSKVQKLKDYFYSKFYNKKELGSSGLSLNHTNEDSEHNIREGMDSLKQRNIELESEIQILRAQNELFRAHASNHTLKLLQQTDKQMANTVDIDISKDQLLEDNYRRDSFSDRFKNFDDLSEVILKFLPIEDKFHFECVSKQFQRTVYKRHYELIIREDMCLKNIRIFESILQKLSNIKSLKTWIRLKDSEIDLIIKNCNHLNEFGITLSEVSKTFKRFFAKSFGPQLTSLTFYDSSLESITDSFVNIQEIEFISYNPKDLIYFYTKIKPKNLKKLSLKFENFVKYFSFSIYLNKYFKRFIENNKSITHLSISYPRTYEPIDIKLQDISQLNQLISLHFEGYIDLKSLTNDLKQLVLNCPKLKSLSLEFYKITQNLSLKTNDFMTEIKNFRELKRIEIRRFDKYYFSTEIEDYFINSLKTGFENLTHLTLDFNNYCFNQTITQNMENIVNNLPKLKKLIIKNTIKATQQTADILSRLSRLETLELNFNNNYFIDSYIFEKKIREKCRKIKSLEIIYKSFKI